MESSPGPHPAAFVPRDFIRHVCMCVCVWCAVCKSAPGIYQVTYMQTDIHTYGYIYMYIYIIYIRATGFDEVSEGADAWRARERKRGGEH